MKNVALIFSGFCLAVACGQAPRGLPDASADEPDDITMRMKWVSKTFNCEADRVPVAGAEGGYEWAELDIHQIRSMTMMTTYPDNSLVMQGGVTLQEGGLFLFAPRCLGASHMFTVTLGLEVPEA